MGGRKLDVGGVKMGRLLAAATAARSSWCSIGCFEQSEVEGGLLGGSWLAWTGEGCCSKKVYNISSQFRDTV